MLTASKADDKLVELLIVEDNPADVRLMVEALKDAKVFVFGRDNALMEAVRIVGDHFEMHSLSSREGLRVA